MKPAVLTVATILLATALAIAPVGAAQGEFEGAATPVDVIVEGKGFGHGRGMGQFGSLGYAIDHSWTYDQILNHFYSNTSTGAPTTNDPFYVHLTAQDNLDLIVRSDSAFVVESVNVPAGQAARIDLEGGGTFRIDTAPSCAGPWTTQLSGVVGALDRAGRPFVQATPEVTSGQSVAQMMQLCTVSGVRAYRGSLRLVNIGLEEFTLNEVLIEEYLYGVVPRESPAFWGTLTAGAGGDEALKAQSVAARSYAIALAASRQASGMSSDACDTQSCQVYGGAWLNGLPLDHGPSHDDTTVAAVNATAGEVRRHGSGAVALTEFASSTGGHTAPQSEGNGFPAVVDDGDDTASNANNVWQVTINSTEIEAAYPEIGQFSSIQVSARNGHGEWGGRTRQIVVKGSAGTKTINIANWSGDSFRKTFGLKSDWYRFPQYEDSEGDGFWVAKSDGTVLAFGTAAHFGDASGVALNSPIVGMAATPSGFGYWLVAADGGIFNYGDAVFHGSAGNLPLVEPIVGMASTPTGKGYWLVASDGGIFTYGDAAFYGSAGNLPLVEPVVGMAPTDDGDGYWLVASDGGIFSYGDAVFYGSAGDVDLDESIVAMAATATGDGYWFIAADGGVFNYGNAAFLGSRANSSNGSDFVAIGVTSSGAGYWLIAADGTAHGFGDASTVSGAGSSSPLVAGAS